MGINGPRDGLDWYYIRMHEVAQVQLMHGSVCVCIRRILSVASLLLGVLPFTAYLRLVSAYLAGAHAVYSAVIKCSLFLGFIYWCVLWKQHEIAKFLN